MIRKIVQIDEEKCDGCGLCVTSCAEGAIQVIDGKARLVSDQYCDGLGACLGECPQDAIAIIERDADDFNEAAVERHLAAQTNSHPMPQASSLKPASQTEAPKPSFPGVTGGCPGSRMFFGGEPQAATPKPQAPVTVPQSSASALRQWPIQLHLLPTQAPIFENRELLIAADCTAFALAGFHHEMLEGRALAIACPKLDDCGTYVQKLAAIFSQNTIHRIHVAIMEVPCCRGLAMMVKDALAISGKNIPLDVQIVNVPGR